jgi:hypothetical protein
MSEGRLGKMADGYSPAIAQPPWLKKVLSLNSFPSEGASVLICGIPMIMRKGILRSKALASEAQTQTEKTFGFKWHQRDTFEGERVLANMLDVGLGCLHLSYLQISLKKSGT